MKIKECLNIAIEENYPSLQALIMLVVFDKKTLTLDQDMKELDFYVQDRFRDRMNPLITEMKEKIPDKEDLYEVLYDGHVYLIKAKTLDDLKSFCFMNGIQIEKWNVRPRDYLYHMDGRDVKVSDLLELKGKMVGMYQCQFKDF
ncbi:hypothetical protein [Gracilibacillus thailandensis]|uniref:Uncharacterized protein n=1 Tax=Gracilibacillus thailandensis TaxID=563735 RepID=A0A6N7QVF7_9BACI|nr:hypothetical protein [Gracilibacillus thailandensis]MRI65132.1 hypothetical protein [Gracilibacillus thailandensis]